MRTAAILPCGARALVLSAGALACIEPESGRPVWERELPDDAHELALHEGAVFLLAGGKALSFSIGDGAPRAPLPLPWAEQIVCEDDGALIAAGPGGAAMRLDGRKRWAIAASGNTQAPALLHRGVVLLHRGPVELIDAAEGLPLAQLPPARAAALGTDLSCALIQDDAVSMHRLATHLSLV
jgi:hypothetical protein